MFTGNEIKNDIFLIEKMNHQVIKAGDFLQLYPGDTKPDKITKVDGRWMHVNGLSNRKEDQKLPINGAVLIGKKNGKNVWSLESSSPTPGKDLLSQVKEVENLFGISESVKLEGVEEYGDLHEITNAKAAFLTDMLYNAIEKITKEVEVDGNKKALETIKKIKKSVDSLKKQLAKVKTPTGATSSQLNQVNKERASKGLKPLPGPKR